MEALVFDSLEPIVVPVKVGSKEYVLLEATEGVYAKYMAMQLKITKIVESPDGSKHSSFDGASELDALLISLSMYELKAGTGEKEGEKVRVGVNVNESKGWKRSITKELAHTIRKIRF